VLWQLHGMWVQHTTIMSDAPSPATTTPGPRMHVNRLHSSGISWQPSSLPATLSTQHHPAASTMHPWPHQAAGPCSASYCPSANTGKEAAMPWALAKEQQGPGGPQPDLMTARQAAPPTPSGRGRPAGGGNTRHAGWQTHGEAGTMPKKGLQNIC
jgi:hypothetical protein